MIHPIAPFRARFRTAAPLAVVIAASVLLAGCAKSANASGGPKLVPGAQTAAQADAEYRSEEKSLPTLPTGDTFPAPQILDHDSNGILETYGPGYGNQIADSMWQCLWMRQVLSDTPGSTPYARDVAVLAEYTNTYIYRNQQEAREAFDPEIQAARLANTGPIATDFAANCSK